MNTLLRIFAGALVLILGALFALPHFVDWDRYRGVFEEEATRVLGREVRVGGQFSLRLLPTPYFSADKVRIADTTAVTGEPFFKADSFTLWLAMPPLLRGVFEARDVEIRRPVMHLVIDGEGRGSWRTVVDGAGAGAFRPKDVALQSVRVSEGTLVLHTETGAERGRIEAISGDLSAPALEGPYRVKATFDAGRGNGIQRELRLSTAKPDADGGVRFKAVLRDPSIDAALTIDARAQGLMERPLIEGTVAAELAGLRPATASTAAAARPAPVEIKANLKGDLYGAALTALTVSFEQEDRPQLLTGEATVAWRQNLELTSALASQWLDLDKLTRGADAQDPIARLVRLVRFGEDVLPAGARAATTIALEQVALGADVVSAIRLSIVSQANRTEIREFRASLPGGTRMDLSGRATDGDATETKLDGDLTLRGTSFIRFLGWASGQPLAIDARNDSAFALNGKLAMAADAISIGDAAIELAGTRLTGEIGYVWRFRRRLRLAIEGPQIDARALLPEGFGLTGIKQLVAARVGARDFDAQVQVRSGRLLTPDREFQDFEASFDLTDRRLRIDALRFKTSDGAALELDGELADPRAAPKGTLRGVIGAATPAAVTALGELLDLPLGLRPDAARAPALAPLRLAGVLALGMRSAVSADLTLDGEINGARIAGEIRLDGGLDGWRGQGVDVAVDADGADLAPLLRLLRSDAASRPEPPGERLSVRAAGIPEQGLKAVASLDNAGGSAAFDGAVTLKDGRPTIDGLITLDHADAGRIASLLPGWPRLGLDRRAIQGTAHILSSPDLLALDRLRLTLDGGPLNGRISLTQADGQRPRVEARLAAQSISVAALLGPLTDRRAAAAGPIASAALGASSAWPNEPFDLAALAGFDGEIGLDAERILVAEDLELSKANLVLVLEDGRLELRNLAGTRRGADWKATMRIERTGAGGAGVSGLVRVAGGRLADADAGSAADAAGPIEGVITFRGQGATPRGLVAALVGGGSIDFGDSLLRHLTAQGLSAAIETALGAKSDDLIATLRREIENRRQSGEIRLGRRRWPLELADGVVRLKPLQLEAEAPRVSASARVDLATFALEAEWRVEPAPAQPVAGATAKAPLPGVVFAYTGTAGRAAALSPLLNMQALERELAVRKLERDVDELERLRRLDEQRARAETERRNAEAAALQRERDQRLGGQPSEPPATPPPATPTPAPGPANATPADRQRLFGNGGG